MRVAFLWIAPALALAAQAPAPSEAAQFQKHLESKEAERRQLWEQKQYAKAATLLEELARDPRASLLPAAHSNNLYNLACAYALLGRKEKAVTTLRQAVAVGYNNYLDTRRDTDFENLRGEPGYRECLDQMRQSLKLAWDRSQPPPPVSLRMDEPGLPDLVRLRQRYQLDEVISAAKDDYGKLHSILKWAQGALRHDGNNQPSRGDPLTILSEAAEGQRFRCVEFGIVVAGAARAVGLPSRVLNLKTRDVETRVSAAGHVGSEVWLGQLKKWVWADGQWGIIVERQGRPLSALELQDAVAEDPDSLVCQHSGAPGISCEDYLAWVTPYLYYFDFNMDQRFFFQPKERRSLMLVPQGAKPPTVFQRRFPIGDLTCTSNPNVFYAPPSEWIP